MLLVITGPPGAGKSVIARALAERFDRSVLVEGDAFFAFLEQGAIPPWLPESHEQNDVVTRASATASGEFARGGYVTVYDGVLGPWFLPTFAVTTGLESLHYVILLPSADRCVERVRTRAGHPFSDQAATRKMHQEFAAAVIDERHVLRDPPDDVREVCDQILVGLTKDLFVYDSTRSP